MKRMIILVVLAIFIGNMAIATSDSTGLFTITVKNRQLTPIIWIGQNNIYALGTAQIKDQIPDCVSDDPDQKINPQHCKEGKAVVAAKNQAYHRLQIFLGQNLLKGFKAEQDAYEQNGIISVIGKVPFQTISTKGLPNFLKSSDGKFTPIILESPDHRNLYALGIAQVNTNDDPGELLNAIELAKDNCQTNLEIYLGQEVEWLKIEKQTHVYEKKVTTAFVLGKIAIKKKK